MLLQKLNQSLRDSHMDSGGIQAERHVRLFLHIFVWVKSQIQVRQVSCPPQEPRW